MDGDVKDFTNLTVLRNVLASVQIGVWAIESDPGAEPRMYADATMLRLMGLLDAAVMTPEQVYRHWYDRVHPDHYQAVNDAVAQMIDWKDAEVQYPWRHPKGEVIVRCGGLRVRTYTRGVRIEGCHRIVTDLIHVQKSAQTSADVAAGGDRILAAITRQLYAFNVTVDLETGVFSIIPGTGMERTVQEMQAATDYRACYAELRKNVKPAFQKRFSTLLALDFLRNAEASAGFVGNLEYEALVDGETRWREVNVFVDSDDQGRRQANILCRDVTDRHEHEAARRREQEAANARDRVLSEITKKLYGFNLTVNLCSATYSVIVGTGMEDVLPILTASNDYAATMDRVLGLVDPDHRAAVRETLGYDYLLESSENDDAPGKIVFPILLSGTRHWHEVVVFRSVDGGGNPLANILGRDVTESHERAERRERERRAAAAKDALLSGITKTLYGYNLSVDLTTMKYTVIAGTGSNASVRFLERMNDYRSAYDRKMSQVPSNAQSVLAPFSPDGLRKAFAQGENGLFRTVEYPALIQGEQLWEEVSIFLGTDEAGRALANLLVRDVTEAHMRLDAEREAERKTAEAKSYFFSTVSHDIRTPLNAILGYTELLKLGIDDPQERAQALDAVVSSGNVLMELINDVLDLSKLESGKMEIEPEPTDVPTLVRETVSAFSLACEKKGVALVQDLGEMPPLQLDPQRIRQILFNLLGNAVKFTDDGAITVKISFQKGTFLLSVTDTGCGIASEDQENLMTPYVQIRGAGRTGGTGLGLAICKQLAARMGGELRLESEFGKGSTFTLELPDVAIAESLPATEDVPSEVSVAARERRVLIVDDSPINLKVLESMLRRLGFTQIVRAASGQSALDYLRTDSADLVLTDLWMPEMDGVSLAAAIRRAERGQNRPPMPIYAVTADVEIVKNAAELGFAGVILKPLSLKNLAQVLAV